MSNRSLTLPDHVLDEARAAAAEDGVPVDQMIASLITEGLGHRRGISVLRERAKRADLDAALAILDRAPDTPPDEGDEPGDEGPALRHRSAR